MKDPMTHVQRGPDCWTWTGQLDRGGYGLWWDADRRRYARAHRRVYEALVGPIPGGLPIDHECRNHACVRPGAGHCVPKTQRENLLLGDTVPAAHRAKTHCPQNHPYDGDNLYITSRGERICRTCRAAAARRLRARRKVRA